MRRFWLVAYQTVLLLLPSRLRRRRAAEMRAVFAAILTETAERERPGAVAWRAIREIGDVIRAAVRLRLQRPAQVSIAVNGPRVRGTMLDDLLHDVRYAGRIWLPPAEFRADHGDDVVPRDRSGHRDVLGG